ncbi:MAG: hypothetical protein ABMA64_15655 [Myxococcota bacterium]
MATNPSAIRALELARTRLDEALAAAPDDPKLLLLRGRADERLEQFDHAAQFFRRAAGLFAAMGDRPQEAAAKVEAGVALARAGLLSSAWTHFASALQLYRQADDEVGATTARLALAQAKIDALQPAEAEPVLRTCIAPLTTAEDFGRLCWVHQQLARIRRDTGDIEGALREARAAVEGAAKKKDPLRFGQYLSEVAELHHRLGNLGKARQYQEKAQPYLVDDDPLGALAGFERLAEIAAASLPTATREELDAQRGMLVAAVVFADRHGRPGHQGRLRAHQARVALALRHDEAAHELLSRAVQLLHQAGDPRGSAPAFVALARASWRVGLRDDARAALERARSFFHMLGEAESAAEVVSLKQAAEAGTWTP